MSNIPYFGGEWENINDVARDFGDDSVLDYNIIIAVYDQFDYEGSAFVLAEKDGKLFEASAGHCSCYGLSEDGFDPGEINVKYLKNRLDQGQFSYGGVDVTEAVRRFVEHLAD